MSDTTVTKNCTDCGAQFTVEIPATLKPAWQAMLRRTGGICDMCAKRAERDQDARRAERDGRLLDARVRRSGMPVRMRSIDWPDLDSNGRRGAIEAAHRWASGGEDATGLLLVGGVGVGKTTIAAAAARAYMARHELRWTSAPALMARLASKLGSTSHESALDVLMGHHALVLDDLDKGRPTEYAAEQLFCAIDERTANDLPLLVTTNMAPDELADRYPGAYGDAIASRLMGWCEAFEVVGPDRRLSTLRAVGA